MEKELLESIIKKYRKDHNLTQKEFADKCGISRQNIGWLESGRNPTNWKRINPDLDTYEKLARGMEMTRDELISRVEGKKMFEKIVVKYVTHKVPIVNSMAEIYYLSECYEQLEQFNVSDDVYKKDNAVAFRITDDALFPEIQRNDMAIIWLKEEYKNGDFVLTYSKKDNLLKCCKVKKSDDSIILYGNLSVCPIRLEDSSEISILGKIVRIQKDL